MLLYYFVIAIAKTIGCVINGPPKFRKLYTFEEVLNHTKVLAIRHQPMSVTDHSDAGIKDT